MSGGEDAVVEGGASGGFVGSAGGHVSRETSESDSDFMPRLKRRWKGREHTHTSPQRTNPAPKGEKRKRGRPEKWEVPLRRWCLWRWQALPPKGRRGRGGGPGKWEILQRW